MDENSTTASLLQHNQENQLLLNAIKNKFAAQNDKEAAAFSPPKFTIPTLKIGTAASTTQPFKLLGGAQGETSNLNQFLLGQLNEKRTNGEMSTAGFVLPTLQLDKNQQQTASKFVIPLLNSTNFKDVSTMQVTSLSQRIEELKVEDEEIDRQNSITIDLTSALSCSNTSLATAATSSSRLTEAKQPTTVEQFHIPFIKCDRIVEVRSNVYCQTDISNLQLRHSLTRPSNFGRIICLKYKRKLPKAVSRIDRNLKAKHKIERFLFDTKSPDDIVLASLSKYQRMRASAT